MHKTKELKIYRLRRKRGIEFHYVTKFNLEQVPHSFVVCRDIFVITYKTHLEYVRVDSKGKENETITRINPLLWHTSDSNSSRK